MNYNNNIATIRLLTKATFNDNVQPICLWNTSKIDLSEVIGKQGVLIGWGTTEGEDGRLSKTLQQTNMSVISSWTCLARYPDFGGHFLSETNFCADFENGLFSRSPENTKLS